MAYQVTKAVNSTTVTRAEQEGAVAHARKKPRSTFSERSPRGEQGAGGGRHDDRQQRAEEDHLGVEGHVLQDQRRRDELRVLLHQALDHAGIDDDAGGVGEEERHRGEEKK